MGCREDDVRSYLSGALKLAFHGSQKRARAEVVSRGWATCCSSTLGSCGAMRRSLLVGSREGYGRYMMPAIIVLVVARIGLGRLVENPVSRTSLLASRFSLHTYDGLGG